jgi:hypothetical protein
MTQSRSMIVNTTPHIRYEDIRLLPGDFHHALRWALLDYDDTLQSYVVLGGSNKRDELQEYACTIRLHPNFKICRVV